MNNLSVRLDIFLSYLMSNDKLALMEVTQCPLLYLVV